MNQRPSDVLTHVPQMSLLDFFAIHANNNDVSIAEESLWHDQVVGGIQLDALTSRVQARYIVAKRMMRVRREIETLGQGVASILPDHEANQKKETI